MATSLLSSKRFSCCNNGRNLGLGVVLGVVIGIMLDNLGVGIALGIAISAAVPMPRYLRPKDTNPAE